MKKENIKIGVEIKKLNNTLHRAITCYAKMAGMDEVTLMHGWIIQYLYENQEKEVFQKDIEQQFSICRSTVTNIIQLMEKKGYIARESVGHDARLKKVVLTDKGRETHDKMECLAWHLDKQLVDGISEAEMKIFFDVMNKIEENATKGEL